MITIESLDKSHSKDVVKILIDSFSKNYDKKINESIFSSDEVDGIVALEKGNLTLHLSSGLLSELLSLEKTHIYLLILQKKSEQYIQMILLHGLVMGHYLKTLI